jgi:hypothetical protein
MPRGVGFPDHAMSEKRYEGLKRSTRVFGNVTSATMVDEPVAGSDLLVVLRTVLASRRPMAYITNDTRRVAVNRTRVV